MKSSTILCCDWGSSSLRVSWARLRDEEVLKTDSYPTGVARTFREWQKAKGISRMDYFFSVLGHAIKELAIEAGSDLSQIPVLISGMASSSIGIKELPYAALPFDLDGRNIVLEESEPGDLLPHSTWLISGVCSETDVMRGEETQAIGLTRMLGVKNGIYIFPGTHSKHVMVEDVRMLDFQTFMTGELFQASSEHTMLAASVRADPKEDLNKNAPYFARGVEKAQISNYLNALFSVRTNQLLHHYTPSQNFYYHSGLHIGYELKALSALRRDLPLYLCGDRHLTPFYELALQLIGYQDRTIVIPVQAVALAATRGMIHIYRSRQKDIKNE